MSADEILIRPARADDAGGMTDIYNHAVLHLVATAQETPQTMDERQAWLAEHDAQQMPVFVAVHGEQMVGWSSLSQYNPRSGYRFTLEDSVYVHPDWCGQGLGKRLLGPLVDHARAHGYHAIVAGMDGGNAASMALHAAFGFVEAGRLPEVVRKFDRWLDVVYMQLLLPASPSGLD